MKVSLKRAQYFITCKGKYYRIQNPQPDMILRALKPQARSPYEQLSLFHDWQTTTPQGMVEVLDDNAYFPKKAESQSSSQNNLLPVF